MKKIKLLSLDLDGTLLHDDKTISPYTADILKRCRERGIIVAVNTGRNKNTCERLLPFINPNVIISSNGSVARHGSDVVYKAPLPVDAADEAVRRCAAHPQISGIIIDYPGGYLAQQMLAPTDPLYIDYKNCVTVSSLSEKINGEVYRIGMLCSNPGAMDEIVNGLPGICAVEPESSVWREIQSVKSGKWLALSAVAERFSIDVKEIAAFGDEWNDFEMIWGAGFGVAMGNARDGVKAAAREICGTNEEDGAARWIEQNLL